MNNNLIYCKDCEFRKKKADQKWCEDFGVSPYYCTKKRGLDMVETIGLYDFCSSASLMTRKEVDDETN